MKNLEPDDETVNTPLVSPFPHSDNDSDDGEVLNELIEKYVAYFDPFLPMNIITRKAYNTIMVEGLESIGKNLVDVVRDVYVFVGSFTYIIDFVVIFDEKKLERFSTWMAFGGNTRDLGSFGEETNKITDHTKFWKNFAFIARGDGVLAIMRAVRILLGAGVAMTASEI
ncbi:hypothetical protein Tco_1037373 [Tanacetum coccineum]